MIDIDEKYMLRALQLARHGGGHTSPNPMVGAVVVHEGRITGEGFHRCCGQSHAEVNAIASVSDQSLLHESTIYVTLEPCSHYGKTPPCAKLLIDKGIGRVVVGTFDPFEKVSGRGVAMLREAGIEVTVGVLERECRELNKRFFTAHLQHSIDPNSCSPRARYGRRYCGGGQHGAHRQSITHNPALERQFATTCDNGPKPIATQRQQGANRWRQHTDLQQ